MTKGKQFADLILFSDSVFTAEDLSTTERCIVIKDEKIVSVCDKDQTKDWIGPKTQKISLYGKTVMPGCSDNHTFFTGNIIRGLGLDLSKIYGEESVMAALEKHAGTLPPGAPVYAHGWNAESFTNKKPDASRLDTAFPDRPVVVFTENRNNCWMNQIALNRYGFNSSHLNFEAMTALLKEYMSDPVFVKNEYKKFMRLMNSKGITSVKDIGYDDFYGVLSVLEKMDQDGELTLRENFALQSVDSPFNLDFVKKAQMKYRSPFLNFQGISIFTDGCIGDLKANMLEPYPCRSDTCSIQPYDYDSLEQIVTDADRMGIRVTLHDQGDRAVRECVNLFEKASEVNHTTGRRHAITSLEISHPDDLERMGRLGISAEDYSLSIILYGNDVVELLGNTLRPERWNCLWNHRKMADSGVNISFVSDIPYSQPNIGDTIYCVAGKRMISGKTLLPQNALTIPEVLRAYSYGGQYANGHEDILGTLKPGKLADITVLDHNVFALPIEEMRNVDVYMTISNGRVVYSKS